MELFQRTFEEQLNKIDKSPAHPFFKKGIINDDEGDEMDGSAQEEIDTELRSYFGADIAFQFSRNKITDTTDIVPIERMEKASTLEDICRDVDVTISNEGDLADKLGQLMTLLQLSQAPGTRRVQDYSWRSWVGWLEEQKQTHRELSSVNRFHPGKFVLGLYLIQMRVIYGYSHSTVVGCFWNQLCALLKEERGIDLKQEMGEFMRKIFRSLLRKYGNSKFKVCPLLNYDLNKWQQKLMKKDNREPDIKLRAIIMYGRHLGWRGDTLSYMRLRDLCFSTLRIDDNMILAVKNTGYKNKGLHRETLQNTVYGSSDFNQCPVYSLLWYLFHVRKVFVSNSLLDVVTNNKYAMVEGAENQFLFTQSMSEQPMTSKDMSNLMKRSSDQEMKCRYTMRSLRSGHICQALLTSILRYGIIKDHIRQAIKRHVGWNTDDSIDAYERMSIFCSQNVASLQDLQQSTEAQNVVRCYFHMEGTSDTMGSPSAQHHSTPSPQTVRYTMRERRRSVNHPKKSPASVMTNISFRRIKKDILKLLPNLKKAVDEEEKTEQGRRQQKTWTTFHHRYIREWCEKDEHCRKILNANDEYVRGSQQVRLTISLNVGKKRFMQVAVGEAAESYIRKVFYEDYQERKQTRKPNNEDRSSVTHRFNFRAVKRRLTYDSSDSSDSEAQKPFNPLISIPEISGIITQPEERDTEMGWVWVWLTETLTQPVFEHFTPSIFGNDRDFEDGSNAQTQPL